MALLTQDPGAVISEALKALAAKETAPTTTAKETAPTTTAKGSTELLQDVITKREGTKKETFGSKLKDTDTLFRLAAGLAAALSGEGAAGAAIAGTGLLNASNEASNANKANEAAIEDLKLKQVDLANQREGRMLNIAATNPNAVRAMGPEFDVYAGMPKGLSLYGAIDDAATVEENLALSKVYFEAAGNLKSSSPERKDMLRKAARLRGINANDDIIDALAKDPADMDTMLRFAAQMDPESAQKAIAQFNRDGDVQKFYDTPWAPKLAARGTSDAELKYKQQSDTIKLLARGHELMRVNPGKYINAEDAVMNDPSFSDSERAFWQVVAQDVDTRTGPQQEFDLDAYKQDEKYWATVLEEQDRKNEITGNPERVLGPEAILIKAGELAALSSAVAYEVRNGARVMRTEGNMRGIDYALSVANGNAPGDNTEEVLLRVNAAKAKVAKDRPELVNGSPEWEEAIVAEVYGGIKGTTPIESPITPEPIGLVLPGAEGAIEAKKQKANKRTAELDAKATGPTEQQLVEQTDPDAWVTYKLRGKELDGNKLKALLVERIGVLSDNLTPGQVEEIYTRAAGNVATGGKTYTSWLELGKDTADEVNRVMKDYPSHSKYGPPSSQKQREYVAPKRVELPPTEPSYIKLDKQLKDENDSKQRGAAALSKATAIGANKDVTEYTDADIEFLGVDKKTFYNAFMKGGYNPDGVTAPSDTVDKVKAAAVKKEAERVFKEERRVAEMKRIIAESGLTDERETILNEAIADSLIARAKLQRELSNSKEAQTARMNGRR